MATHPSRRDPRTEPPAPRRSHRAGWIAALAALALAAGAFVLTREDDVPTADVVAAPRPADVPAREPTATEASDPAEQRRLSELEERRGRYGALRSAFGTGTPPSPASVARLSPVLHALWPAGTVAWTAACVGQLCRVDAPPPAPSWQERLADDPGVRALVERVVVDPDGAQSPAYLVLIAAGARPGASVLDAVEEEFRASTEIRDCLSRIGATGSVEYAVSLDSSGYSYRQSTDLPLEALDCADRVLGEILDRHPPVQPVQTATRTLTLRR